MKRKFILLAMMLLTLMGGVKFNVLNAQIDLTKQYRLKVNEGGYAGKYLHVNSFYAPNNQPQVGIAAKAENTNQIFTLEDAGNGNYYLKCATNDYYIKCAVGSQWWCVYAYSTTEKTPLYFHYTDGTNFYLRDYDKMMGIGGTDAGLTTNNYFKVENNGVYCDASPNYNSGSDYNANTSYVTTWSLEEVVFSVAVSADATEIWSDETVNLTAVATDGAGSYTYSWSPATGLDDATSATPVFTPTAAGTYTFTCTATDANGATATSEEISILVKDVKDKPVFKEFPVGEGTGSASNLFPTHFYYKYSLTQQIYTASELGFGAGKISGISFYGTLSYDRTRTIDVYIRNIDETKFNNYTDWKAISSDDKVYSGSFTNKVGWVDITFDKEFEYEGGNILICIDDNTGSYSANTPYKMNADTDDIKALSLYTDYNNYDPFNITNSATGTSNSNNYIIFTVEVSTDPSIEVNCTSLNFGTVRAGGDFWTEKETPSFNVNVKAKNTTIKSITGNDDFFNFSDVSGAVDQTEFNFTVSYNKEAEAGEKSGNIVVTYMNGEEEATVEIPMTATAYVPAQGDVVENPVEVTFDENGVYTYTINSLDVFYDDYVFSPNEQYDVDAKDMAFSFTLTEDALVHVTDENYVGSWCSLYGDFTVENGPQYKKDYSGEQLLSAGTYYVVISPNQLPFNLKIEKSSVPAPIIYYSSPMNESANNDNPMLEWNMQYADEYQVLFGTSEDALETVIDWNAVPQPEPSYYTYSTSGLQNNTKYYWQVNARNEAGTTTGEVQSFVTLLDVPQITSATSVNLYPGETTTIKWEAVANATSYKVYNGEWTVLATLEATETSYDLSGLEYNMTGHNITVTATQEGLGESLKSTAVVVKVAGTFPLTVNVKDSNNKPIEGATVTVITTSAYDEFYNDINDIEPIATDANGMAVFTLPLLGYNNYYGSSYYQIQVSMSPYKVANEYIYYYSISNNTPYSKNLTLYLPVPSSIYPENYEYMLLAGGNLTLNWTAVEGATEYNVYKTSGNGVYTFVKTVTENTYTAVAEYDANGSKYAVSAVFEGGLESDKAVTYDYIYVLGKGSVKGLVKDTEGNPVVGAALELSGTTGFGEGNHILETEADGTFLVEDVIEGAYSLTVSHYNYEVATVSGILVNYNIEYELETIELTPKASIENVTVTADNNGNVSWTGDYAKWNVYRRNTNAPQKLISVATKLEAISTIDAAWETLEPGTYQYGVSALVEPQAQTRGTEVIFEEGFENNGTTIPTGWTRYSSNGWNNWTIVNTNPYEGTYCAQMYSYSTSIYERWLRTPEIELSVSSPILKFYYKHTQYQSYSTPNTFHVKVKGENDAVWNVVYPNTSEYVGEYTLIEIPLEGNYSGNKIQIEFYCSTGYYSYTYVDNISIVAGSSEVETQIVWSNDVVKQGPNTFEGTVSTEWNVAENWSNGVVPATGDEVIVNAEAVISGNVELSTLDIVGNGRVTVDANASLTVTGAITQEQDYSLIMNDGAQVFQNNANVTAQFNMNLVNPSDWSTSNKDGWQFISSPLSNVNVTNIAEGNYDLYKYDGEKEYEWVNHKDVNFADNTYQHHIGYLASHETKTTLEFKGTLNYNDYYGGSYAFFEYTPYSEDKLMNNYYLLGNPYPFNIKWADCKNSQGIVNGFAYVKDDGNYEYATSGEIAVGDGFFVQAISGTGETDTYCYYVKGSGNTRSTKESNNSLNITATGNAGKDNVVINFAGKSEGFDKLQNFNDAIATVYVAEGGKNYGIYNCDADVQEVELSFNANKMGNYTISIEPNGKFETVTLVDRFTGVETNMLVEDYNFTAMSSDNHNRFIVRFANGQQTTDNSHFVYQSGEELILNIQGEVQIVDVLGRVVYNGEAMNDINRINVSSFNSGAYMVKVMNGNEVKVEKVVIY